MLGLAHRNKVGANTFFRSKLIDDAAMEKFPSPPVNQITLSPINLSDDAT